MPDRRQSAVLPRLAILAPVLLYVLALNPWFVPDQHDDVLYFFGAVSLVEGEGFALGGVPITDWPPVLSAAIALAMSALGPSVWVAKGLVLATVVAGIMLIVRTAKANAMPHPALVAGLTALLPVSLISGVSVLSEWPYLAASLAFLLALGKLESRRDLRWAMLAGLLLALASLTRFVGVFLGAAIVVQALRVARARGARAALPELVAAAVGAALWLAWKVRCESLIGAGHAPPGAYDQAGYYLARFTHLDPLALFAQIEAVLLSLGKAVAAATGWDAARAIAGAGVAAALVTGAYRRWRSGRSAPCDAYVGVTLLLLLGDLNKPERYFVPIAPFLLGYLIDGVEPALRRALPNRFNAARLGAAALWAVWLLALDAHLLFRGNLERSRAGFSMLASPDIERYYRGDSLDLYHALRWADQHSPAGPLAAAGFHGKYVLAFTGRRFRTLPGEDPEGAVALISADAPPPPGWLPARAFGRYTVNHPEPPARP